MIARRTRPRATLWYLTRGTGVVALLLLTAGLVLGVLSSTRWRSAALAALRRLRAAPQRDPARARRSSSCTSLTTVLDGYAPIGLRDAVVPFASRYRPVWLGLGAVAFDLLLALIVTSLLRARIGLRTWQLVHWLAYASWPVALVHAFGTGSDAKAGWFDLLAIGSAAAVVLAVLWRVVEAREGPAAVRVAGGVAALALPVAIARLGEPAARSRRAGLTEPERRRACSRPPP